MMILNKSPHASRSIRRAHSTLVSFVVIACVIALGGCSPDGSQATDVTTPDTARADAVQSDRGTDTRTPDVNVRDATDADAQVGDVLAADSSLDARLDAAPDAQNTPDAADVTVVDVAPPIDIVVDTGPPGFNVASAASTSNVEITVTFDAAPDSTTATDVTNYDVPGLTFSGTPVLAGNTVTLSTSAQHGIVYTVTVSNVTRASDGQALAIASANFVGIPSAPTVTGVTVMSTVPSNGPIPYNTGTTTVQLTGTDFALVACPAGVTLDDLDGAGMPVTTVAASCSVDSDNQITATFPAGIRTNGITGWNVRVNNGVGSNTTSDTPFVPVAGLLISEIYTGTAGSTDHEYIEIYNPTSASIDATGIGLHLHVRGGTGTDTHRPLTPVTAGIIPSHGFILIASSASVTGEAWFANRDFTYSASTGLVGNGGAYISLSTTANIQLLDRVGWGTQPAPGFDGTAATNIVSGVSSERRPAAGAGHNMDTDNNNADFTAPSAMLTPRGSVDLPQP